MMSDLLFAYRAVFPLEAIVLLGYILAKTKFIKKEFFNIGDKLVFYLLLPCTIFSSLYSLNPDKDICLEMLAYIFVGTTLLFILALISGELLIKDKKNNLGVSVMTTFRANSAFIGLPLAKMIGGDAGIAAMSLSLLVSIPIYNVYTVVAFAIADSKGKKTDFKKQIISILKNPLIISCVVGLAALLLKKYMPLNSEGVSVFSLERDLPGIYTVISDLASASTVLALLNVGGQIEFSMPDKNVLSDISFGCIWRMLLSPLFFVGAAAILTLKGIFSFTEGQMAAILANFAGPASVTAASLTQEMGGNANLCRQYIFITNILLIVTLPVFILVLRQFGLL